nr:proline-rich protein HaeIII subfamily 1-like [Equus asinus]
MDNPSSENSPNKRGKSGERRRVTVWRAAQPQPPSPRGGSARAPRARSRGAQRPHTPARDWPAPQSFSADTSGQPLPPSSRPLLPALGKKSGQRGAGTKDPAAPGYRGCGAAPLQAGAPMRPGAGSPPTRAGAREVSRSGVQSPGGPTHEASVPDSGNRDSRALLPAGRPSPAAPGPRPPRSPQAKTSPSSRLAPPAPAERGDASPSALRGDRHPPSAANATRQPWQRRERGARAAPAPRPQRAAAAAAWGVLPPAPGQRSAPPTLSPTPARHSSARTSA